MKKTRSRHMKYAYKPSDPDRTICLNSTLQMGQRREVALTTRAQDSQQTTCCRPPWMKPTCGSCWRHTTHISVFRISYAPSTSGANAIGIPVSRILGSPTPSGIGPVVRVSLGRPNSRVCNLKVRNDPAKARKKRIAGAM